MTVPISDAATTKFKLRRATLVDDALARTKRRLLGVLHVKGRGIRTLTTARSCQGMGH